jgi:HD domain
MSLYDMESPDTAAAVAANQVARRYCSSALYAHSVRSYLWGIAYAEREGLDFDGELFYVAAMLHDVGLTRPFDAHQMPFEEAGGQVAWVLAAAAGWPDDRRMRVAQVIEKHMWPSVDPLEDVEGHLLEVATSIDISGRGLHLIPIDLQTDVIAAWPRLDLAAEFTECLRLQGERKPTSRAADLTRDGLADALRDHPQEPKTAELADPTTHHGAPPPGNAKEHHDPVGDGRSSAR